MKNKESYLKITKYAGIIILIIAFFIGIFTDNSGKWYKKFCFSVVKFNWICLSIILKCIPLEKSINYKLTNTTNDFLIKIVYYKIDDYNIK